MNGIKTSIGAGAFIAIGIILLIPATGTAVYEARASRRAQARLDSATQDYNAAAAQVQAVREKVLSVEKTRAELIAEAEASEAAAAARSSRARRYYASAGGSGNSGGSGKSGAGGNSGEPPDPLAEGQKFFNEFPQARALMLANNNPAVMKDYAPFIRQANLNPAQTQQFLSLVATSWADNLAVTPQGTVLGPNANPSFDQMSQVVGDQAAEEYENYTQTMTYPYRFTDEAATMASLAGTPLSDQQNDQLAQIIASNAGPYTVIPGTIGPGNWSAAVTAVNWDATIAQAKAALPQAQFEAVQGALLQLQFQAEATTARQNNTAGAGSP